MKWACSRCAKDFGTQIAYDNHMGSSSHNLRCYHPDCHQMQFANSQDMRAHRLSGVHGQVYECNECQKGFHTAEALKQHRRASPAHTLFPVPFVSHQFANHVQNPTAFAIQSSLANNQRNHCELCRTEFATYAALKAHLNSLGHIRRKDPQAALGGTTQYLYCQDCNRDFKDADAYEQHMRNSTIHLSCRICNTVFDSPASLDQHMRSTVHNPASLTCGACSGRSFKDQEALDQHLRTSLNHAFCVGCERCFPSNLAVRANRDGFGTIKLLCPDCASSRRYHGQHGARPVQAGAKVPATAPTKAPTDPTKRPVKVRTTAIMNVLEKVAPEPAEEAAKVRTSTIVRVLEKVPLASTQGPLISADEEKRAPSTGLQTQPKKPGQLLCIFCDKDAFLDADALRWHMASEHMYCTYCAERSGSIETMFKHLESREHSTNRAKLHQIGAGGTASSTPSLHQGQYSSGEACLSANGPKSILKPVVPGAIPSSASKGNSLFHATIDHVGDTAKESQIYLGIPEVYSKYPVTSMASGISSGASSPNSENKKKRWSPLASTVMPWYALPRLQPSEDGTVLPSHDEGNHHTDTKKIDNNIQDPDGTGEDEDNSDIGGVVLY